MSSAAGRMWWGLRVGVVTGTSMRLGMEGIEDEQGLSGRSTTFWWVGRGEGEKRGGEGWCGEKGFWVSGIGEEVRIKGCVDGAGEGGLIGSDSRVETLGGENVGLEERDSSTCGVTLVRVGSCLVGVGAGGLVHRRWTWSWCR